MMIAIMWQGRLQVTDRRMYGGEVCFRCLCSHSIVHLTKISWISTCVVTYMWVFICNLLFTQACRRMKQHLSRKVGKTQKYVHRLLKVKHARKPNTWCINAVISPQCCCCPQTAPGSSPLVYRWNTSLVWASVCEPEEEDGNKFF